MDIGPVILEHISDEPIFPEQEDFGPNVLRHKVYTLFSLGHRDYVPTALDKKDFKPVDLGW